MTRFEFAAPGRVVFGAGSLSELGPAARGLGRRALLVTGRSADRVEPVRTRLVEHGLEVRHVVVDREPDLALVRSGAARAREGQADLIVAAGGGSVIDAAKAIAALAAQTHDVLRYLEVVGDGQPLERPALPVVAVPTTAGTGAEATRNAVLDVPERRVKVSLRHASLLPRVALVDPGLTSRLPPGLTATTGLDALTQLIEAYVSVRATPMTDALCVAGIPLAAGALPRAVADGAADAAARAHMALAALWSGMALANAGLGAVHGLAGAIGGRTHAPHGAICAALLPHVVAANVAALDARDPESPRRARFEHVARLLTGTPEATAADGVEWLRRLVSGFGIPPLSTYGLQPTDADAIVPQAQQASSMKGNPIPLTHAELAGALDGAL